MLEVGLLLFVERLEHLVDVSITAAQWKWNPVAFFELGAGGWGGGGALQGWSMAACDDTEAQREALSCILH